MIELLYEVFTSHVGRSWQSDNYSKDSCIVYKYTMISKWEGTESDSL